MSNLIQSIGTIKSSPSLWLWLLVFFVIFNFKIVIAAQQPEIRAYIKGNPNSIFDDDDDDPNDAFNSVKNFDFKRIPKSGSSGSGAGARSGSGSRPSPIGIETKGPQLISQTTSKSLTVPTSKIKFYPLIQPIQNDPKPQEYQVIRHQKSMIPTGPPTVVSSYVSISQQNDDNSFPKSINEKIKLVSSTPPTAAAAAAAAGRMQAVPGRGVGGGSAMTAADNNDDDPFYQKILPKFTQALFNSRPMTLADHEDSVVQYRSPNAIRMMEQAVSGSGSSAVRQQTGNTFIRKFHLQQQVPVPPPTTGTPVPAPGQQLLSSSVSSSSGGRSQFPQFQQQQPHLQRSQNAPKMLNIVIGPQPTQMLTNFNGGSPNPNPVTPIPFRKPPSPPLPTMISPYRLPPPPPPTPTSASPTSAPPRETYMTLSFEQPEHRYLGNSLKEQQPEAYSSNDSGSYLGQYQQRTIVHSSSPSNPSHHKSPGRHSDRSKVSSYHQQQLIFDSEPATSAPSTSNDYPITVKTGYGFKSNVPVIRNPSNHQLHQSDGGGSGSGSGSGKPKVIKHQISPTMTLSFQNPDGATTHFNQQDEWKKSVSRYAKEFGFEIPNHDDLDHLDEPSKSRKNKFYSLLDSDDPGQEEGSGSGLSSPSSKAPSSASDYFNIGIGLDDFLPNSDDSLIGGAGEGEDHHLYHHHHRPASSSSIKWTNFLNDNSSDSDEDDQSSSRRRSSSGSGSSGISSNRDEYDWIDNIDDFFKKSNFS